MASLMDGLKARLDEIRDGQVKLFPVPRWSEPTLHFRCRPPDGEAIARAMKSVQAKDDGSLVAAYANVVALAIGAGKDVLFSGREPLSLRDLAGELGLGDDAAAADVVRAVIITDGDLHAIFAAISTFSGFDTHIDPVDEVLAGE